MKVYLAGPMQGIPNFNFPTFIAVAACLRGAGYEVFNPAERDIERHGTDISADNPNGSVAQAEQDHKFSLRDALAEDTAFICKEAEGIVMLPGWERSYGAKAEHALAVALRHKVLYLDDETVEQIKFFHALEKDNAHVA